jgi:competence protein ComEC
MDWRFRLTDRIIETVGPRNGPIAAGLITGEARAISEEDFDALKASNLYHIIAISGGHMVVIAGVIYLGLRLLFLLLPGGLANKPAGKSAAAAITLLLTTLYLAVTGAPISAVRAYAMIVFLLLAVILMRRVHPMRSLSLAFWLMLLIDPSDLLEPGFQLSFAATLAIVALVEETWFKHHGPPREEIGFRIKRALLFALLISVVAELATMPLSIAMFNNFSLYGILANVTATPLVSLFLMPVVALFFLLLPFGLESVALSLLDQGISALLWIADTVAALPKAQMFLPSLPGWGVGLFVLGLCWFCLFERRPRYLGLPMMLIGFLSLFTVTLPDILISPNATQIAVRTEEGYMQAKGRKGTMIAELWANGLGQKELLRKDKQRVECGDFGCITPVEGKKLAFPTRKFSAAEMCARADIIITKEVMECADKHVILASGPLRALWLPERIETSSDWQGRRPWVARPAAEADE